MQCQHCCLKTGLHTLTGETPLCAAARQDLRAMALLLLDAGAGVNAMVDVPHAMTPLFPRRVRGSLSLELSSSNVLG